MPEFSPKADLAACRTLMRGGSLSFYAASHLLPRRIRDPATALYAFCRLADDAVDERDERIETLVRRLELAYSGYPVDSAADRVFAAVVTKYQMPRALPLALLEGFAWDAEARRYRTLEALLDYAARVAGSVGAMMAVLMGARTPHALARACDLGVAMQLTNIARDVGEDARAGRLYLPLDWFDEAACDPSAFIVNPAFNPDIAAMVERLLQTAAVLYARGTAGIAALPAQCRPGIRAAGLIYAEIGKVLAHVGHDSVAARAHVPARRKTVLLTRSLLAVLPTLAHGPTLALGPAPALPACQFLVDAAACDPVPTRAFAPARALDARITWVFDLFERLHDQQWEVT